MTEIQTDSTVNKTNITTIKETKSTLTLVLIISS